MSTVEVLDAADEVSRTTQQIHSVAVSAAPPEAQAGACSHTMLTTFR